MKVERDGKGALANENIETNISGEILQFSRALNFTLHIKKTARGSKGKRKWKTSFACKSPHSLNDLDCVKGEWIDKGANKDYSGMCVYTYRVSVGRATLCCLAWLVLLPRLTKLSGLAEALLKCAAVC